MNILIDCSNLKAGGGVQVATSFINDLNKIQTNLCFYIVLTNEMYYLFNKASFQKNIIFIKLANNRINKFKTNSILKNIEKKNQIALIFCIFGPSYYKSKCIKIVGYAIPHYIYEESPYFKKLNISQKIVHFIRKSVKVYLFKAYSDYLIFETDDSRQKFCQKYDYKINRTYVVNNTINGIFDNPENWSTLDYKFKKSFNILCLGANYDHKNYGIIPKIIDLFIKKYQFYDFNFVLSLNKEELNFSESHNQFISYLGTVSLNDLPILYNSVQILFMPSLLEIFSATYIEAMKMKVPIVASDLSFARKICKDSAVYFDPNSPEDATKKILNLLNNKILCESLIINAQSNLSSYGNSMNRTSEYLKIISDLVQD